MRVAKFKRSDEIEYRSHGNVSSIVVVFIVGSALVFGFLGSILVERFGPALHPEERRSNVRHCRIHCFVHQRGLLVISMRPHFNNNSNSGNGDRVDWDASFFQQLSNRTRRERRLWIIQSLNCVQEVLERVIVALYK